MIIILDFEDGYLFMIEVMKIDKGGREVEVVISNETES
jgi:hypothetical protein